MGRGYFPHQMTRMSSLHRGQGLGEHCSSPGGVWGRAPAENENDFCAFSIPKSLLVNRI